MHDDEVSKPVARKERKNGKAVPKPSGTAISLNRTFLTRYKGKPTRRKSNHINPGNFSLLRKDHYFSLQNLQSSGYFGKGTRRK